MTEHTADLRRDIVWRFTPQGAVEHAVRSDGTNRGVGPALCGRLSSDGRWHYGPHFGSRQRCLTCKHRAGVVR